MDPETDELPLVLNDPMTKHLAEAWGVSGEEAVRRAVARASATTTTKRTGLMWVLPYSILVTGLLLMFFSVVSSEIWHFSPLVTAFSRDLGLLLSAVIAGTILHEKLLRDEMVKTISEQLDRQLEARIPTIKDSAVEVHRLFTERPPRMKGIRRLNYKRRNYIRYYDWVNKLEPQELFFAGRSVLHRIATDIHARYKSLAEDALFRRLKQGSKIKILFLDPRTDMLARLAEEEGQTVEAMLEDIATSMGVCKRLFNLLQEDYADIGSDADLTIRVYDRIPYFAFHKQNNQVIVGFYFRSLKGSSSAAYEPIDGKTKQAFSDHFMGILSDASNGWLVEFEGARGRPRFNNALFDQMRDCIYERIGQPRTDQLLEGGTDLRVGGAVHRVNEVTH